MNPGNISVALLNVIKNWARQTIEQNLGTIIGDHAVTVVNAIKDHLQDIPSTTNDSKAVQMCQSLLGLLEKMRDEFKASEWTMIKAVEFNMLMMIYTSGEATVKRIIESLNLLSLVDKARAEQCKQVAKDILSLQKGQDTETGAVRLVDLQKPLDRILSVTASKLLKDTIDNATQHFGIGADQVRYALVNVSDIEVTFNEPDFTTSLMCKLKVF